MAKKTLACLVPLLFACGDDPPPLFADMQWQVSCEVAGMCTTKQRRDIMHLDGQDGHSISCSVVETSDGNLSLTFNARLGNEYGVSVTNAVIPKGGGGLIGAGCRFQLTDDASTYEGDCSGNAPTDERPCQIKPVMITEEREGPTVSGEFLCVNLPNRSDATIVREVTAHLAAFDPTNPAATMPANFSLLGCSGL